MADNNKSKGDKQNADNASQKDTATPAKDSPKASSPTADKAASSESKPDTNKDKQGTKSAGSSGSGKADSNSTLDTPKPGKSSAQVRSSDKAANTRAQKPPSTAGLWFITLVSLMLSIAVAAGGYWIWSQRDASTSILTDQQSSLGEAQTEQADALKALEQQTEQLAEQLDDQSRARAALSQTVQQLQQQNAELARQNEQTLQQVQSQLENMEGKRPADWLLAEADYLVRMAGRKVWLEKDIKTAIMLLNNADQRLAELADPSVLPVRELIAKDIQTLRQLNPVSRTSVALALSGMLAQVPNLALDTFTPPDTDASGGELSESVNDWKQNLQRVWRNIVDDFITVSRSEQPIEPVMSQQQQWLSREQLKLQLMQAQSAALQGHKTLFDQSLQNALDALVRHYDTDDQAVQSYMSSLQNLVDTNISQELPESLQSSTPLRRLLEQRVDDAFGQGAQAL